MYPESQAVIPDWDKEAKDGECISRKQQNRTKLFCIILPCHRDMFHNLITYTICVCLKVQQNGEYKLKHLHLCTRPSSIATYQMQAHSKPEAYSHRYKPTQVQANTDTPNQ